MKIAVAGTGYVGLSLAVLLSQRNEVVAVDVIKEKVEKLNKRVSPIQDKEIVEYLTSRDLNLKATTDMPSLIFTLPKIAVRSLSVAKLPIERNALRIAFLILSIENDSRLPSRFTI